MLRCTHSYTGKSNCWKGYFRCISVGKVTAIRALLAEESHNNISNSRVMEGKPRLLLVCNKNEFELLERIIALTSVISSRFTPSGQPNRKRGISWLIRGL